MTRRVKITRQNLPDRVKIAYGIHPMRVDSKGFILWRLGCTCGGAMRFDLQLGTVPKAFTCTLGLACNHGTMGSRKVLISRDNLDSGTHIGVTKGTAYPVSAPIVHPASHTYRVLPAPYSTYKLDAGQGETQ